MKSWLKHPVSFACLPNLICAPGCATANNVWRNATKYTRKISRTRTSGKLALTAKPFSDTLISLNRVLGRRVCFEAPLLFIDMLEIGVLEVMFHSVGLGLETGEMKLIASWRAS